MTPMISHLTHSLHRSRLWPEKKVMEVEDVPNKYDKYIKEHVNFDGKGPVPHRSDWT